MLPHQQQQQHHRDTANGVLQHLLVTDRRTDSVMDRLIILTQEKRDFMNHSDFISEEPCHRPPSHAHTTKKVIYKCQPRVSAMTDEGIEGQRDGAMERPQGCRSQVLARPTVGGAGE